MLAFIALSSSMLVALFLLTTTLFDFDEFQSKTHAVFTLDFTVNMICLYLQYSWGNSDYKICCKCCDNCFKKIVIGYTIKKQIKKAKKKFGKTKLRLALKFGIVLPSENHNNVLGNGNPKTDGLARIATELGDTMKAQSVETNDTPHTPLKIVYKDHNSKYRNPSFDINNNNNKLDIQYPNYAKKVLSNSFMSSEDELTVNDNNFMNNNNSNNNINSSSKYSDDNTHLNHIELGIINSDVELNLKKGRSDPSDNIEINYSNILPKMQDNITGSNTSTNNTNPNNSNNNDNNIPNNSDNNIPNNNTSINNDDSNEMEYLSRPNQKRFNSIQL